MDYQRKRLDPTLVCTCNDLYVIDITEAIEAGETVYKEIQQFCDTLPRCGECRDHVDALVKALSSD